MSIGVSYTVSYPDTLSQQRRRGGYNDDPDELRKRYTHRNVYFVPVLKTCMFDMDYLAYTAYDRMGISQYD